MMKTSLSPRPFLLPNPSLRWIALGVALAITLGGCGARGEEQPPPFEKGMVLGLHYQDEDETYWHELREIADMGADAVCLMVSAHMTDATATQIKKYQRDAPSAKRIEETLRLARDRDLLVLYMPIVLLETTYKDSEWRGSITPASADEWFESYREFILHHARLAQRGGATCFAVGSEFCSMEQYEDEWRSIIAEVREVYDGLLIYSANWDHYRNIPWLDEMDFLGINAYHKMSEGEGRPSVADMQARWEVVIEEMQAWQERWGKELVITEVGYPSQKGMTDHPWDYTASEEVDLEIQRDAYKAMFKSWEGKAWVSAFFVYDWWGEGGPEDTTYTARGKPAQEVLEDWFARD